MTKPASSHNKQSLVAFDHDHCGCRSNALMTAERLCHERGIRFTPIRRQVLELVWESHRAVKAYDLLERIRPDNVKAKPVTVYRALDFLLQQGLIHRVESLNAFIGCSFSGQRHEQLFLTCVICNEIEERPAERVMQAIADEMQQADFTAHRHAIEIHGVCSRCSQQQTKPNS